MPNQSDECQRRCESIRQEIRTARTGIRRTRREIHESEQQVYDALNAVHVTKTRNKIFDK